MQNRADRPLRGYSKGMRQRIKLAQALISAMASPHTSRMRATSETLEPPHDSRRAKSAEDGERRIRHQGVTNVSAIVVASCIEQEIDPEKQEKVQHDRHALGPETPPRQTDDREQREDQGKPSVPKVEPAIDAKVVNHVSE